MVSENAESQVLETAVFERCWELANQMVSTYDPELSQERSREDYLADFLTVFVQIHRVVHPRAMRPDLDADLKAIERYFRLAPAPVPENPAPAPDAPELPGQPSLDSKQSS